MRSAQSYIDQCDTRNSEYPCYYHESAVEEMINQARADALMEAERVVKKYADKVAIINLIKEIS